MTRVRPSVTFSHVSSVPRQENISVDDEFTYLDQVIAHANLLQMSEDVLSTNA